MHRRGEKEKALEALRVHLDEFPLIGSTSLPTELLPAGFSTSPDHSLYKRDYRQVAGRSQGQFPHATLDALLFNDCTMRNTLQTEAGYDMKPLFFFLLFLPCLLSAAEPVRIGIITDLSGRMAHWGVQTQRGAELAVRDLTARGINAELKVEDAVLQSMKAVSAAQKLLGADKVDAVYSEFSPISVAIAPLMKDAGKLFVFDAGASSPLSSFQYAFKSYIDYISLCREAALRWQKQGIKRVATLKINAEPGEHCEIGLREVDPGILSLSFNQNDDLTPQVMVLKRKGIEAVALASFEPDLLNLLRPLRNINYKVKIAVQQNAAGDRVKESYSGILDQHDFFGMPQVDPRFSEKFKAAFPAAPETSIEAAALAYLHITQIASAFAACPGKEIACAASGFAASPQDNIIGFLGWKDRIAQFHPVFWKWTGSGWMEK